jgi:hypothetical protein
VGHEPPRLATNETYDEFAAVYRCLSEQSSDWDQAAYDHAGSGTSVPPEYSEVHAQSATTHPLPRKAWDTEHYAHEATESSTDGYEVPISNTNNAYDSPVNIDRPETTTSVHLHEDHSYQQPFVSSSEGDENAYDIAVPKSDKTDVEIRAIGYEIPIAIVDNAYAPLLINGRASQEYHGYEQPIASSPNDQYASANALHPSTATSSNGQAWSSELYDHTTTESRGYEVPILNSCNTYASPIHHNRATSQDDEPSGTALSTWDQTAYDHAPHATGLSPEQPWDSTYSHVVKETVDSDGAREADERGSDYLEPMPSQSERPPVSASIYESSTD